MSGKKCLTHKPWPKVYVEELEAQHWTAWGWDIIKREKRKFSRKHFFSWKKNPMTFFKKWKFSKSHFFRKSQFSRKIDFFEKSDFLKIFIFLKNVIGFFFKKKIFFMKIFSFSLFMISHPQAVQCWASNSSTYTFGHGLCVRHFFKNPKNHENPKMCTDPDMKFLDSAD